MTAKAKRHNIMVEDFKLQPQHTESNFGESMTVPDESMTIRQIMKKFVKGMKIEDMQTRTGYFEDDVDFDSPDMEKLRQADIFDQAQAYEESKQQQQQIQQQTKQKQKAQAEKDAAEKASQKPEKSTSDARTKDAASADDDTGK